MPKNKYGVDADYENAVADVRPQFGKQFALYCPDCKSPMTKAGGASFSKSMTVQMYRCPKCKRRTGRPLDYKGNRVDAKPYSVGK